ncbi:MAG: 16S rRNA (guanine(966)-N(2))-methyltransferase RsmD [Bacteroidales bacterium]|jgi:16S rRNA (guanine(966)-N(2))-methyltransferase RsmD|nr:16S rRNA (guanine(966)-N(2))-methyltransferase RsmD [Bacteroidales bacterium]
MRIISGSLRGRRLNPPANLPVRPTTDMARESLFNILNNYVDYDECSVLDLFAGTGAVSVEFVSRGAKDVTSVDINNACTDFMKKTAQQLSIQNMHVVRADVFDLLKRAYKKFDIVFADPPYALNDLPKLPEVVFESDILNEDGIFILEHPKEYVFEENPFFWQHRNYGKVNFTFFAKQLES